MPAFLCGRHACRKRFPRLAFVLAMRALLVLLLLVALTLAGCSDDASDDGEDAGTGSSTPSTTGTPPSMEPLPAPTTHESVMRNNRFVPADFTVRVGDTIHWTTEDPQAHNVVSETAGSEFRSSDISTVPVAYDQEFSYTFTKAGVVDYVCEYHLPGMVGKVTVLNQTA